MTVVTLKPSIGMAALARMFFERVDVQPLWGELVGRATADPTDAAALMDLATMLLLSGDRDGGLGVQAQALEQGRLYRRPGGDHPGLRLLALVAPGDTMANTPLDFLLEGSDIDLLTLYVGPGHPPPDPLPDHDVAFLAIGESEANLPSLRRLEAAAPHWPRPLINGRPDRIAELTRDGVCALLADVRRGGRRRRPPGRRAKPALARSAGNGAWKACCPARPSRSSPGRSTRTPGPALKSWTTRRR